LANKLIRPRIVFLVAFLVWLGIVRDFKILYPGTPVLVFRIEITSNYIYTHADVVPAERMNLVKVKVKVKVKVILRLAVYRQSICLGVKPLETYDQNCFPPS
jgi:hypothetical protein